MKPSGILQRIRDRITPPGSWTQGLAACDRYGQRADVTSDNACSWCSTGAIWCEIFTLEANKIIPHQHTNDVVQRMVFDYVCDAVEKKYGTTVVVFNDTAGRTQQEVLAMFDEAIAQARKHEAKEVGLESK